MQLALMKPNTMTEKKNKNAQQRIENAVAIFWYMEIGFSKRFVFYLLR